MGEIGAKNQEEEKGLGSPYYEAEKISFTFLVGSTWNLEPES
jgi:hypothetical protein